MSNSSEPIKENKDLAVYMQGAIERIITTALKASLKNPKETLFLMSFLNANKKSKKIREKLEANGQHVPPFLIASITKSCNLFCKGCYAREFGACGDSAKPTQLSSQRWDSLFTEAEELGISFILLAGGEPMMRMSVIQKAAAHKKIMFPIFSNGTLVNDDYLNLFEQNRNLFPVLSIEGDETQTDSRRGAGTYEKLANAMTNFKSKGILFGASVTVTKENLETVTSKDFIDYLYKNGCKSVIYVEYVPVTEETKVLAPTEFEREELAKEQEKLRILFEDMIFISFPGDEKYTGGCLAAGRGFFHINAEGNAEPCPFSPYSDTNLNDSSLKEALNSQLFKKIKAAEMLLGEHTGGCTLFEKEDEVRQLLGL